MTDDRSLVRSRGNVRAAGSNDRTAHSDGYRRRTVGRSLRLLLVLFCGAVAAPAELSAQSLRLAEIDAGRLLSRQEVDLYVSVTNRRGEPVRDLTEREFTVLESTDGETYTRAPIAAFDPDPHVDRGITFQLLVDNSGSMYDTLEGDPTDIDSARRMSAARRAIESFVESIDNPRDTVGLASFNTFYEVHVPVGGTPAETAGALDEITRPDDDAAFTELYRAIDRAARTLADVPGRTVLVVLSDGENFPFAEHRDAPHPRYEDQVVRSHEALATLEREGIGLYAINFAGRGDPALVDVVQATGGLLYDAAGAGELSSVYREIRTQVLEEYRITYRPSLAPGDRRFVRVQFANPTGRAAIEAGRPFVTSTIFGLPAENFGPGYAMPFVAAIAGAFLVGLLRFRSRLAVPNLEVLDPRGRATQVIEMTGERTIIGSSGDADVTVAGTPDMKDRHATIVHDQRRATYTVMSEQPIKVNNQKTTKRILRSGDVVQLPGATIVFEEPERHDTT